MGVAGKAFNEGCSFCFTAKKGCKRVRKKAGRDSDGFTRGSLRGKPLLSRSSGRTGCGALFVNGNKRKGKTKKKVVWRHSIAKVKRALFDRFAFSVAASVGKVRYFWTLHHARKLVCVCYCALFMVRRRGVGLLPHACGWCVGCN